MTELEKQGQAAQKASKILALASSEQKNQALDRMAAELLAHQKEWLEANRQDVEAAGKAGMNSSFSDRLTLTEERIKGIVEGLRQVALLTDPVGQTDRTILRPNGLRIQRKRVPLGVIALIFEARPNVVADAAALCLKSGNACILRGGKEAIRSNTVAVELMRRALSSVGLPEDCISLVKDTSRDSATELMHLHDYVDVLIPRGGAGLIRAVMKEASVPVIRTGEGVCHVYIDKAANLSMGANILFNAKCSRPAVCNAAECLLVHRAVAKEFLEKRGFGDRIKEFDVSSATVELAAVAVGCEPAHIAKTLAFLTGEGPVLIVAAGDAKIDNHKYKSFFGVKAKMLTVEQVSELIGHEVGGVCPYGIKEGVKVYLDESLRRFDVVYPACGSSNSAVKLSIPDLEKSCDFEQWVDVCKLPQ